MGVPITFLDKHNPDQFELVDARVLGMGERQRTKKTMLIKDEDTAVNGVYHYARVAIRRTGRLAVSTTHAHKGRGLSVSSSKREPSPTLE